jgi:hypothetical protein
LLCFACSAVIPWSFFCGDTGLTSQGCRRDPQAPQRPAGDLDRIISRTLAWGLLTVLLGGGYAVVILGLGQLLGRDSSLAVAAATLAAAALFHPVRRRVQAGVDRRFNRRRHDAAQKIVAFSGHLREQVDLDTLTGELLAVVEQTMQPTQASLWLRLHPPSGTARFAGTRQGG